MACWFNLIGFAMLFSALFLNELVYLNVWYGSNFVLIAVALVYLGAATWLSVRSNSNHQHAQQTIQPPISNGVALSGSDLESCRAQG